MLELVNKTLYQRPIESQYIALTFSIYDPVEHKITMANSGLPYPLLIRNGQTKFLDLSGIPLGLFPESKYQEIDLSLESATCSSSIRTVLWKFETRHRKRAPGGRRSGRAADRR